MPVHAGMQVVAFDVDENAAGARDDLVASGVVQRAPAMLACRGSRWVLWIDAAGVRHESEIRSAAEQ